MKKYLLFDLDGTLTDPKVGITTCVQYALKDFGIEEPDLDKLEPFIGPPLKDSFMQFYGMEEAQAERAIAKYRERFTDIGIFENTIYDGVPAMLRTLQARGMHLAVASSKATVFVERILQHFHIDKYFEVVVGSELDGTRSKKDEVVIEALKRLFQDKPVQCDQVYMIGDRKFDVEGAKAHKIESVGVAYGYGSMEELKEARADYIVRSVEELQRFLLRETEEELPQIGKNATIAQKIWAMAFPFLMFLVVKEAVMAALILAVQWWDRMSGGLTAETAGNIWIKIIRDETGAFAGVAGNAAAIITALSYVAGAAAIGVRARKLLEKTAEDMKLSHLRRETPLSYVMLILAAIGLVPGLNLLFNLTGMIDSSAAYQAVAAEQYSARLLVGLVCYGLITPLAEELLFRGVLYNYLRKLTDFKTAIFISALLFGIYHMNVVQGLYGFLMGCLMAYAYEYFGDYKMPVLLHIISNVMAFGLSYTSLAVPGAAGWLVCIASLAIAAVCIGGLHKRKNIF